jgi:hypothetical protein
MLSERFDECDREPLVPCAVTENCPVEAVEAAPNTSVIFWPAATEKGLIGLLVIPAGRLFKVTCTLPENPFSGVTETVRGELVPPCGKLTDVEENARLKSA